MTAVRWQGLAFVLMALLVVPIQLIAGRFEPQSELLAVAVLVVVLGVPHGALDIIVAEQRHKMQTSWQWALFGVAYVLPVMGVIAIWHWFPLVFLFGFLVISAAHFSGDPEEGTPAITRCLYGGAPVILPVLLHAAEVETLFSLLTGPDVAAQVVPALQFIVWPWLIGLVIAIAIRWNRDQLGALEIAMVGSASSLAPPLIGFAIFFCGMHSARHILRTAARFQAVPLATLLRATLSPMALALFIAGGGWLLLRDATVSEQIMQLLFVGLAAVTVPHMILVDAARLLKKQPLPG